MSCTNTSNVYTLAIANYNAGGDNSPSFWGAAVGQFRSSDWSLQSGFPSQTNRCWIHLEELAVPLLQLKWPTPHWPVPCTRWDEQNSANKLMPNISPNIPFPIIASYNSYRARN